MNKEELIEYMCNDFKASFPDYNDLEIELLKTKLSYFNDLELNVLREEIEKKGKNE